jgi:hypothetical protein
MSYTQYNQLCNASNGYLSYPSYLSYVDLIEKNMHSPPYYVFNQEKRLPIFYNYLLPNYNKINLPLECQIDPRYQYWYTSQ